MNLKCSICGRPRPCRIRREWAHAIAAEYVRLLATEQGRREWAHAIAAVSPPPSRVESPSPGDGLDEDVLYLAQAAEHLTDHLAQEVPTFACEDLDNVQHFAAKIIAAATEQEERTT